LLLWRLVAAFGVVSGCGRCCRDCGRLLSQLRPMLLRLQSFAAALAIVLCCCGCCCFLLILSFSCLAVAVADCCSCGFFWLQPLLSQLRPLLSWCGHLLLWLRLFCVAWLLLFLVVAVVGCCGGWLERL